MHFRRLRVGFATGTLNLFLDGDAARDPLLGAGTPKTHRPAIRDEIARNHGDKVV